MKLRKVWDAIWDAEFGVALIIPGSFLKRFRKFFTEINYDCGFPSVQHPNILTCRSLLTDRVFLVLKTWLWTRWLTQLHLRLHGLPQETHHNYTSNRFAQELYTVVGQYNGEGERQKTTFSAKKRFSRCLRRFSCCKNNARVFIFNEFSKSIGNNIFYKSVPT